MFLPSSSASLVKIYGVAVSIRTIPFMDLLSRFFLNIKKNRRRSFRKINVFRTRAADA